jgi:hypothetical protein
MPIAMEIIMTPQAAILILAITVLLKTKDANVSESIRSLAKWLRK